MADRVGSDHPSVSTSRGRLVRRGGTRRPAVSVSGVDDLAVDSVVRLVLDGHQRHAPVVAGEGEGGRLFAGAYDNARLARERSGDDRLAEWVSAHDLEVGRSVLVDVVEPGEVYGLRRPGETTVYAVGRGPDPSLRDIAADLDG